MGDQMQGFLREVEGLAETSPDSGRWKDIRARLETGKYLDRWFPVDLGDRREEANPASLEVQTPETVDEARPPTERNISTATPEEGRSSAGDGGGYPPPSPSDAKGTPPPPRNRVWLYIVLPVLAVISGVAVRGFRRGRR